MSLQNILVPNHFDIFADEATVENINLVTINGDPYVPGSNFPDHVAGTILVANGSNTLEFIKPNPSYFNNGTANQILVTNNAGNASIWSSDINVNSIETVNNVDIGGNLIVDGTVSYPPGAVSIDSLQPGTANQILVTDNAGTFAVWADDINVNKLTPGPDGTTPITDVNGDVIWAHGISYTDGFNNFQSGILFGAYYTLSNGNGMITINYPEGGPVTPNAISISNATPTLVNIASNIGTNSVTYMVYQFVGGVFVPAPDGVQIYASTLCIVPN